MSSEGSRVIEPSMGQDATAHRLPTLLDIATVARMLSCSVRHVHRLRDSGRMPHPIKRASSPRLTSGPKERELRSLYATPCGVKLSGAEGGIRTPMSVKLTRSRA